MQEIVIQVALMCATNLLHDLNVIGSPSSVNFTIPSYPEAVSRVFELSICQRVLTLKNEKVNLRILS